MSGARRRVMRSATLLPWIVAFKAFKTVVLIALGITLLTTRSGNVNDVLIRFALALHLPLTSRLFNRALAFASHLTAPRRTTLAITAFGYAALMGTEGVALHLRKPWARWLTIIATSSLIPIELYEIAREPHPARIIVLFINVAVVIYLWTHEDLFGPQERPVTVRNHGAAR